MLLPKIKISFFLVLTVSLSVISHSYGQIEIDRPIILTSTDTSNAQVRNVSYSADSNRLVSAATYQSGSLHLSNVTSFSIDSMLIASPLQLNQYKQGLLLIFIVPSSTHDSVYINVNGLGWKELVYKKMKLHPGALKPGQMLQVVYDGNNMQIINEITNTCPPGFVEASLGYCIETNESTATANFFDAALNCGQKNARLCSWNEWYFACQNAGLGLSNITDNYEWVNDAMNSNNQVLILGNGGCIKRSITLNTNLQKFRCCYSK